MAITQKNLIGYFETEYSTPWPGLITNLPSSRIPPSACFSCNAMVVRGRLQPQPGIFPVTGFGGLNIILPTFAAGENVCLFKNLQRPGSQQGFTVIITNFGVYVDYIVPTASPTTKTFTKIFTFPTPYPRYARFGTRIIGSLLYFSSASQLGVYVLRPTFSLSGIQVTNGGGYFTSTPIGFVSGGGGTGASLGVITVTGNFITAVGIGSFGSGYTSAPPVSFSLGTSTGPLQGQSLASAIGILSTYPTGYVVQEVSANTGVSKVQLTTAGSGYTNPQVIFVGGGGSGATALAILNATGGIGAVQVTSPGINYTSAPTVQVIDAGGTGSGFTGTVILYNGSPFIGGDFMSTMSSRLILANIIGGDGNNTGPMNNVLIVNGGTGYTSAPTISFVGGGGTGAAATAVITSGVITAINMTANGNGYTTAPAVNAIGGGGTGAVLIAQVSPLLQASSTTNIFPDRVAWSGPNAYGIFDPNYLLAPGGNNTITEAQGLITSANVVESVGFIGHNGGITEMTPNTSNALVPFSFFPLWSADEGVLVRYGSMAQYGSTLAFLANDNAYFITPNGMTEIGLPIGDLLQNAAIWNNGNFILQGLYGSIVLIEGQKHYLITMSADDTQNTQNRRTQVFDYNMSENSWHFWGFTGQTATCPIYQCFDTQAVTRSGTVVISRDSWLLTGMSTTVASADKAVVYDVATLTRQLLIGSALAVVPSTLSYQFRTESPSIARMQSERRIAIEYENIPSLTALVSPILTLNYVGQQDPTTQTGTVSQIPTAISQTLNYTNLFTITGQVLTSQADFGTFTGVCTSLSISATGANSQLSLVRITQVADIAKAQLP